jgi:DNA polymerase-3 subunit gamma/tau
VTIASGTSIDVIEMDAASNRSVDDVRDLRERVAYAPAGGRWKVYILDEAHMLTKEAWNAFLKTLEEPPPNTVFVLATTEAHKVMATIADRCQRFDFQRPTIEQISEVIERVANAEGLRVDPGAASMIARSATGSFRDALGTLDQLVAFGGEDVGLEAVLEMLGAADAELIFETVDAVAEGDPKGVLLGVDRMARAGRDPAQFARDLLAHLRHLLVTQTVGEVPETFVVTASDEDRLAAQAQAVGAATLVRTIDELAAALSAVREGDDARLAVEIALLKAARPDVDSSTEGLMRRVERLEAELHGRGGAAGPAGAAGPVPAAVAEPAPGGSSEPTPPAEDPAPAEEEEAEPEPPARAGSVSGPASEGAGGAAAQSLSLDELREIWPAVIDTLRQNAPALAATFDGAHPVRVDGDELTVGFPAEFTFNKRKAEAPDKREIVHGAIEAVLGTSMRLIYVMLDGEQEDAAPKEEAGGEGMDADAAIEKMKSEFNAEEVG